MPFFPSRGLPGGVDDRSALSLAHQWPHSGENQPGLAQGFVYHLYVFTSWLPKTDDAGLLEDEFYVEVV